MPTLSLGGGLVGWRTSCLASEPPEPPSESLPDAEVAVSDEGMSRASS
jgi:hypothetical protein